MKPIRTLCLILVTAQGLSQGCTHTAPGTSVELALAKRADPVPHVPLPTPAPAVRNQSVTASPALAGSPPIAPLPTENTDRVADAYSRGKFCLEAGNDAEAITAFQEVVKIDPTFTDAWNYLAALYEKTGQDKLALVAFKKSKETHQ